MNTLDVGYRTYSIENSKFLYGFGTFDFEPGESHVSIDDSIGESYNILKTVDGTYLLSYKIRGRKAIDQSVFTAAQGFFPIPADIALLIIDRDRSVVGETDDRENGKKLPFDEVIESLQIWLDQMNILIEESVELKDDLINDLREMIACLNANSFR